MLVKNNWTYRANSPYIPRNNQDLNVSESKIPVPKEAVSIENTDRGRQRSQTPSSKRLATPKKPPNPAQSTPIKRYNSTPTKGKSFTNTKQEKLPTSPRVKEDDFGVRLHNKAKEIEVKKEQNKKQNAPEYTFTPVLSERNERILSQRHRGKSKSISDEVAIVSGILSFSKLNIAPFSESANSNSFTKFDFKSPSIRPRHLIPNLELKSTNSSMNRSDLKENIYD